MTGLGSTRRTAPRRALWLLVAVPLVAGGCLDDVTGTRPLMISVTADDTTPTVGQTVRISFDAQGTGIAQIGVDFGDGDEDLHTYSGPVTAVGFSEHAYAAPGTYVAVAQVVAVNGSLSDSVTITVN